MFVATKQRNITSANGTGEKKTATGTEKLTVTFAANSQGRKNSFKF